MQNDLTQIEPDAPLSWRIGIVRVLALSAPIIPAMLAQMLIGFADGWMASQIGVTELHWGGLTIPMDTVSDPSAGRAALAAVTPAALACWTLMSVFIGAVSAVTTFAAQAIGRGEDREAGRYAWQGIYLAGATVVVVLVALAVARLFFGAFTADAAVLDNEVRYFRVRICSLPLAVVIGSLGGFFNGIHRPARPAVVGVITNLLNLLFCWLLVFGRAGFPRLGVAGSAWAAVLASALGAAALLAFSLQPAFARPFGTITGWRFSLPRLRNLLRVGLPSGASWLMDMIGWTLLAVVLIPPLGEATAAASNATLNYLQLGFMPVVGVGVALSALVGKAIGQRRPRDARRLVTCAFVLGGGYQLLVGVALVAFRVPLVRFFSQDPMVVSLGSHMLILAGVFQVFDAMGIIYTHALRGAGDTVFLFVLYAATNFLFFIPAGWLGAVAARRYWPSGQAFAPWIAGTAYVIVLGLACWARWRGSQWERVNIFGDGPRD